MILITHKLHHAYPLGDSFAMLDRGRGRGTFAKGEIGRDDVLGMMAGGKELDRSTADPEAFAGA